MNATESDAAWRAFMNEPVHYVDAERLAPCFGGALPAGLCGRMLAAPRLTDRLSGLIASHYQLPPPAAEEECDAADRAVAVAPEQSLSEILARAGVIFWSASIANTVLAPDVSALQSAIGEPLCSFAVKHRDLAGPERPLAPFDTLPERMTADGWRCFAAWCDATHPAIGARARLKLPAIEGLDAPPPEPFVNSGPAIIRRAAQR
jgi:YOP proteins translocation protein K (YscK)